MAVRTIDKQTGDWKFAEGKSRWRISHEEETKKNDV